MKVDFPLYRLTIRGILYGTTDWFKVKKEVLQGCLLSPCLFNLYSEYVMRNSGLDELQLESRWVGETPTTSNMQIIPL